MSSIIRILLYRTPGELSRGWPPAHLIARWRASLAVREDHRVQDEPDHHHPQAQRGEAQTAPEALRTLGRGGHQVRFQLAGVHHLLVLARTVALEFLERHAGGENHRVDGELFGTEVRVEEVNHEDETDRQQGFVAVDGGGDVHHPAGEDTGEGLGEPEHQAGAADDGYAPKDGEVIEFFPIGPAAVLRALAAAQEPLHGADEFAPVAAVEQHALGSGDVLKPGFAALAALLQQVVHVQAEISEGQDGAEAVNESRGFEASQHAGQELGPGGVGELQGHAGEGETEEARDHHQVQVAVERTEAAHVNAAFAVAAPGFFAVLERAREPGQRVGAGDYQRAYEKRGHAPEGVEEERILLRVVVGGVGEVSGELAVRAHVALAAGVDDVGAAKTGARVGDGQDVVRAVAVVTLGGLQVAQLRDLAVDWKSVV